MDTTVRQATIHAPLCRTCRVKVTGERGLYRIITGVSVVWSLEVRIRRMEVQSKKYDAMLWRISTTAYKL